MIPVEMKRLGGFDCAGSPYALPSMKTPEPQQDQRLRGIPIPAFLRM